MKKNKMMRFASVLLVAVLLSTCAISGTFAKYTSTASGTATAKVAKWDVKVGDVSLNATTKEFTFNLFDTIMDTYNAGAENHGDADRTVADECIAPGTKGTYTITVNNKSEVNAKYTVGAFTVKADGADLEEEKNPIVFTIDHESADIAMNGGTATITVTWTWGFEGDSAKDMALAGKDITVVVPVTVEQVD